MYPLVSVVLPVYNRETTIRRALDSVLGQTYTNIEVIVVDDGSTDDTVEIIKNYKDERVHLICQSRNQGANSARNRGIEWAKGEYVAFQDSDDEWLKDKLEKQMHYMIHSGKSVSYSSYYLYEGDKVSIIPRGYRDRVLCEYGLVDTLKKTNVVGTPTLIVKRELFSEIGMFDEEIKCLQDYEFVIRLAKKEQLGYVEEPLVNAYRMKRSVSTNVKAKMDAYVKIVEKHFDFVDMEATLYDYLKCAESVWGENINWQEFDQIIAVVRQNNDHIMAERCYKIAIEYFYERHYLKQKVFSDWYYFFKDHISTHEFAIYGAGMWGQKVYHDMKMENCIPKCFLVTEQAREAQIDGVPIECVEQYMNTDMPVIVAVAWEKQKELIKNLLDREIHNFCVYPYC